MEALRECKGWEIVICDSRFNVLVGRREIEIAKAL
jgi:hypothetical protein